jgi:hypothetical protein
LGAGERLTLDVTLERLWDLPGEGWFGGDTHVHLTHRPTSYPLTLDDGLFFAEAEDLHLLTAFDPPLFDTAAPERRRDRYVVRACQETGSQFWGHVGLHHLQSLVRVEGGGQAPTWPLNGALIDAAHAQGGFATYAHPITTRRFGEVGGWPAGGLGRGLPVDAALGRVDALDVLAYSNVDQRASLSLWYRLLNAGLRVAPSAGTDCGLCRAYDLPVAGYRTYAFVGDAGSGPSSGAGAEPRVSSGPDPALRSGSLDVGAWWRAVRGGRSFVSNGPLLTASVGGALPGAELEAGGSGTVSLEVHWRSALGVGGRLEIVRDGVVCASDEVAVGETDVRRAFEVDVRGAGWIAARFVGPPHALYTGGRAFAHSGPFYVASSGGTVAVTTVSAVDAQFFVDWIDKLAVEADRRGWPGETERAVAQGEFARARAVFAGVAQKASKGQTLHDVANTGSPGHTASTTSTRSVSEVSPDSGRARGRGLEAALALVRGEAWLPPPFTFAEWETAGDSAGPSAGNSVGHGAGTGAEYDPVFDLPMGPWGPLAVVDVHVNSREGRPLSPVLAVVTDGEVIVRHETCEGRWRGLMPLQASIAIDLPGYASVSQRLLDLPAIDAVRKQMGAAGDQDTAALVRRLGQLGVHFALDRASAAD